MTANQTDLDAQVAAVRRFNRFYTRLIGALDESMLESGYSLTQVRVMYELAHADALTARDLAQSLALDRGYLSRILSGLETAGLIARTPSPADARRAIITLTDAGRGTFAALDTASANHVKSLLGPLGAGDQAGLVGAMARIERLLGGGEKGGDAGSEPYLLREPHPGDLGWVIHRHGALYAREHGWDQSFEGLAAEIVGQFVKNFDPARERCWIAEREGEIVGSVFVIRECETVARLRMLYVEPSARGLGIGQRLVAECIRFARDRGYARLTLWTNDVLTAARHIYQAAGFELVDEKPQRNFGHDLIGQTWDLGLT